MRRALLRRWPALTKFYGLRPSDVAELTLDELNEYLRQYDAFQREQQAAQAAQARAKRQGGGRRRR